MQLPSHAALVILQVRLSSWNLRTMVDQEGRFKKISSDPSQAQVDQKGHLRIRQLDLIATCLSTLDLEELTKVETSFE